MKIKMVRVRRHKWFPFMVKDVELEITTDEGRKYKQPIYNGWILNIRHGEVQKVFTNYK